MFYSRKVIFDSKHFLDLDLKKSFLDFKNHFFYENNFYLTAPVNRISKFITHLDLFRKSILMNKYINKVIGKNAIYSYKRASNILDNEKKEISLGR